MSVARTYLLSNWTYPTFIGVTTSLTVIVLTQAGDAIQEALDVELTEYR